MCPLCTVAVGVGLGLSRWFRIDDLISGLWIGAFIISLSAVTATLSHKYLALSNTILMIIFIVFYLGATIVPFWYYKLIGVSGNTIMGVDKLIFGITIGMAFFLLSHSMHLELRKKSDNTLYLPFQKVFIPVWVLLAISIIVFLLMK
jgi:hypothetical protein